jgi:hypothetical protein
MTQDTRASAAFRVFLCTSPMTECRTKQVTTNWRQEFLYFFQSPSTPLAISLAAEHNQFGYHESGRDHRHARSYGSAASSSDDCATGCNYDQQERAPGFREDSPPLKRAVQEVG